MIIMAWFWFAYTIFKSLSERTEAQIAAIPAVFVFWIFLIVAVFKHSEMTFVPFILALLRFNINPKERVWKGGTDSFQPIDVGYLTHISEKKQEKVDIHSKIDKIETLENKIDKI